MSLTRPAFHIVVTNVTRGWTVTSTHGPATYPPPAVVLLDGMTHRWGFTDDRVPGPLDPAQVTFSLGAFSLSQLPEVRVGDIVTVRASRPLASWPGNATALRDYFYLEGRLSDPELVLDPHLPRAAQLRLTVTDFLADLNSRIVPIDDGTLSPPFLVQRYQFPAMLAALNVVIPRWTTGEGDERWTHLGGTFNDADAHTLFITAANTAPVPYTAGERVVSYPRPRLNYDAPMSGNPRWQEFRYDETDPMSFWVTPILRRLPGTASIYYLMQQAGVMTAFRDDFLGVNRAGMAYVDGCTIRTPVTARLAREDAVDTIVSEGWQTMSTGETTTTTRSRSRRSGSDFGRVTRTVPTQSLHYAAGDTGEHAPYMADRTAEAFMPDGSADAQPWGYDTLDVCTWLMSDNELDRLAPMFCPPAPTEADNQPRMLTQLIVHDVDETVATDDRHELRAIIAGATTTINAGQVLIQPRLVGGVLPVNPVASDAVTAAQLLAAGAPYSTFTAATIDPTLTAVDFRLIGPV